MFCYIEDSINGVVTLEVGDEVRVLLQLREPLIDFYRTIPVDIDIRGSKVIAVGQFVYTRDTGQHVDVKGLGYEVPFKAPPEIPAAPLPLWQPGELPHRGGKGNRKVRQMAARYLPWGMAGILEFIEREQSRLGVAYIAAGDQLPKRMRLRANHFPVL